MVMAVGQSKRFSGVIFPVSRAAKPTTTLKVESRRIGRAIGSRDERRSFVIAVFVEYLFFTTGTNSLGLKPGCEAIARISPLLGSMMTKAPCLQLFARTFSQMR